MRQKTVQEKDSVRLACPTAAADYRRSIFSLHGDNVGYLFILPAVLFLLAISVYPLLRQLNLSLYRYYLPEKERFFIGLTNYANVVNDPLFWNAVKNTTYFTAMSVIAHLVIGLGLALLLNMRRGAIFLRNLCRGFLILPWLFSTTVAACAWLLVLHPFGMINNYLLRLHLFTRPIPFFGKPATALSSLVAVNVWKSYPFFMLMFLAGLQAIPDDLYEAAKVDGANTFQAFLHITIPQLRRIILTLTTLDVIWTFVHFDLIYLITNGGPLNSTELMATYTYRMAFEKLRFGYSSALGIAMFLLLLLFSAVYVRIYAREGDEL